MKFFLYIIFLAFMTTCTFAQGQQAYDYGDLLERLEMDIPNGNKRTLRDLGSLLDKKETDLTARKILRKATLFTPEELDVSKVSKQRFLDFYYENEAKLQFSELLNGFYVIPLEFRKVDFKMQSTDPDDHNTGGAIRRHFKEIDDLIAGKKFEAVISKLSILEAAHMTDGQLMIQILQDQRLFEAPEAFRQEIYQKLLNQLLEYPEIEIAEIALQMWEGHFIGEDFAGSYMTQLLNCTVSGQGTAISYYQNLLDSLGTLDDIRRYGYELIFDFKLNFFQFPVDYYGKILGLSGKYPWISKNAIHDLKKTRHPRSLFYLAAYLYRNRHLQSNASHEALIRVIHSITNVKIGVADKNDKTTFAPPQEDEIALLNYLIYWASSYQDYEWDENRELFTNKLESLVKTQNYEKLFRRLNSRNDSVAFNSFLQLTKGDPVEINALSKKYRQLLRNHNASLPSMKYRYLEQLTLLTNFCTKNNFQFQANKKNQGLLDKLYTATDLSERYAIENQFIEKLDIDNITVLEYWACLHESNKALTFSAGRILDWFYSKNWKKVINSNDQLRFYLKKSYLFESIGVSGVCNAYLNKFDTKNKHQLQRLRELEKIETDEDIVNQISILLAETTESTLTDYNLDGFLENPTHFKRRDIKILPPPTMEDLNLIVDKISRIDSEEEIKQFFVYLRLHPQMEFIPKLFELIDDKRIVVKRNNLEIRVADHIIPIIENVYAYNFPRAPQDPYSTSQWKNLWERDSSNYKNWEETFFIQKLDSLQYKTVLSIDDLNQMIESPHYTRAHKPLLLEQLKKIKPLKNIRRLNIEPLLSVEQDLKYFEHFFLSYKELDDIPKLFDINASNTAIMLHYLKEKSATFNFSEKGSFYNNLFRSPWLNQYLNSKNIDMELVQGIQSALTEYLNESDFLSEYEEQASIMHIAQIEQIGMPLEQKLLSSLQLDADNATKNKVIDEIIASISYQEISVVFHNFNTINAAIGDEFCAFLHRDFGLPVFGIENQKMLPELLNNHVRMTEYQFYLHYLKAFGVDFMTKKGDLDFQKISDILQFDIISPFVGERGGKRDDYSYGIIKLLELTFETRLGFHEKLNEAQTFYSFSSNKRAQAWINYLREHHLIDQEIASPPSFNQVKKAL